MKKLTQHILIALAATVYAGSALASGAAAHAEPSAKVEVAPFGDAAKGKNSAAACLGCHGNKGNSVIAAYPKLAGQNAKYLYKQMQDFKSGVRENAIMASQLTGRSDEDMKNMAAYFAEQEVSLGKADKDLAKLGEKLYRGGNPATGVSACIACHGPAGKGMSAAGFPAVGAQHADYTSAQLKAFRAAGRGDHKGAKRTNDGVDGAAGMMQTVAAKLSDDEIKALSSYLQGLR